MTENDPKPGFITVYRNKGWTDRGRSYNILVDGKLVGTLRAGKSFQVQVGPGEHSLQAKISWTGSGIERLTILPDQHVRVLIAPNPSMGMREVLSADEYLLLLSDGA